VFDERELLALIEGESTPLALVQNDTVGDVVIEAVSEMLDEWVLVIKEDTLAVTDNDATDDKDGTTVIVDVSDASIETVVVNVLSIDMAGDVDGKLLNETLFDASLVRVT
jgi:hypothetical protein